MRMIKFRAKRVNGGEWVKSMTISYGTIKRKMYNVFFEVEPNKWVDSRNSLSVQRNNR